MIESNKPCAPDDAQDLFYTPFQDDNNNIPYIYYRGPGFDHFFSDDFPVLKMLKQNFSS